MIRNINVGYIYIEHIKFGNVNTPFQFTEKEKKNLDINNLNLIFIVRLILMSFLLKFILLIRFTLYNRGMNINKFFTC